MAALLSMNSKGIVTFLICQMIVVRKEAAEGRQEIGVLILSGDSGANAAYSTVKAGLRSNQHVCLYF
jgi:hypothetical protein